MTASVCSNNSFKDGVRPATSKVPLSGVPYYSKRHSKDSMDAANKSVPHNHFVFGFKVEVVRDWYQYLA